MAFRLHQSGSVHHHYYHTAAKHQLHGDKWFRNYVAQQRIVSGPNHLAHGAHLAQPFAATRAIASSGVASARKISFTL
jgi:hypothetical protein